MAIILPHLTDQYSHWKKRSASDKAYEATFVKCHDLTDCSILV